MMHLWGTMSLVEPDRPFLRPPKQPDARHEHLDNRDKPQRGPYVPSESHVASDNRSRNDHEHAEYPPIPLRIASDTDKRFFVHGKIAISRCKDDGRKFVVSEEPRYYTLSSRLDR